MNNTLVEYIVVIFGDGPYSALSPDFSLMASGATREDAMKSLYSLMTENINISKQLGTPIPKPTSKDVIEATWNGDYMYSSVSVQV